MQRVNHVDYVNYYIIIETRTSYRLIHHIEERKKKKQEFHHNGRLDLYGIPKEKRKILR